MDFGAGYEFQAGLGARKSGIHTDEDRRRTETLGVTVDQSAIG
jgi:hypothetical protein